MIKHIEDIDAFEVPELGQECPWLVEGDKKILDEMFKEMFGAEEFYKQLKRSRE